jgi:hypothetical protein
MTDKILNKSLSQNTLAWEWQSKNPSGMYEFAIVNGEKFVIEQDGSPVLELTMNPSESNYLTFQSVDSGIELVAIFNDLSMINEGEYDYSISVISAHDSRKVQDSGTLVITS